MATFYQWNGDNLIVRLHVQPRAADDRITGVHGDALKIRITAPPVAGKANDHLVRFLASVFGVNRGAVELTSGESGRRKTVLVRQPSRLPPEIQPR